MRNKGILITNIQRFSLYDGPGIRTTVFLKGCSLRCPWCSNPENLVDKVQNYTKDGVNGIYGKYCSSDELYFELMKDRQFYNSKPRGQQQTWDCLNKIPGGVTFSGGECLLQMKQLKPLMEKLYAESVHMAVETSLFVPCSDLKIAIQYIDLFYVDVKLLDERKCKKYLQGNLHLYLSNFHILANSGRMIVARIPMIGGYTDDANNKKLIYDLIQKYKTKILKIELIKEHNLGISKYQSLIDAGNQDIHIPNYQGISEDVVNEYKKELENTGIAIEICKI